MLSKNCQLFSVQVKLSLRKGKIEEGVRNAVLNVSLEMEKEIEKSRNAALEALWSGDLDEKQEYCELVKSLICAYIYETELPEGESLEQRRITEKNMMLKEASNRELHKRMRQIDIAEEKIEEVMKYYMTEGITLILMVIKGEKFLASVMDIIHSKDTESKITTWYAGHHIKNCMTERREKVLERNDQLRQMLNEIMDIGKEIEPEINGLLGKLYAEDTAIETTAIETTETIRTRHKETEAEQEMKIVEELNKMQGAGKGEKIMRYKKEIEEELRKDNKTKGKNGTARCKVIWGSIGMLLKCSEKINVKNKDVLKSWNGFRNYFMKDTIDIRHVERKDVVNMIKERMKDFYTQTKVKPNMAMIKREGLGQIFTGK